MRRPTCVALVLATPLAAAHASGDDTKGLWKLTPLARVGDEATGGRFQEIGSVHWSLARVLVFQARTGPKEWGLYSQMQSQVRRIAPNMSPDLRYDQVRIHPGGALHYVVQFGGHFRRTSNVYGWDGEHLSRVLVRGDKVPVGGVAHVIDRADVENVAEDGRAILSFETDKPRKVHGYALHDGQRLRPLVVLGDPLPGLPAGVRAATEKGGVRRVLFDRDRVVFMGETVFVPLDVTGGPYGHALFALAPDRAEKVLAVGDELPVPPGTKVTALSVPRKIGDDRMLVLAVCASGNVLLSYSHGAFEKILDIGQRHPLDPARSITSVSFHAAGTQYIALFVTTQGQTGKAEGSELLFWTGGRFLSLARAAPPETYGALGFGGGRTETLDGLAFLRPDAPYYAFTRTIREVRHRQEGLTRYVQIEPLVQRTLHMFDGQTVSTSPTSDIAFPGGPFRGWSLPGMGYVPFDAPRLEFRAMPVIDTADGRHLTLRDILAWVSNDEALVRQPDGVYLLTARP